MSDGYVHRRCPECEVRVCDNVKVVGGGPANIWADRCPLCSDIAVGVKHHREFHEVAP